MFFFRVLRFCRRSAEARYRGRGDGTGDFKTIQAAVESIPTTNRDRVVVFIKDGTYHEKIRVDASFVTLYGQSRKGTRIEFPQLNKDFEAHRDDLGRAVINLNHAGDFVLQNLTVENTASIICPLPGRKLHAARAMSLFVEHKLPADSCGRTKHERPRWSCSPAVTGRLAPKTERAAICTSAIMRCGNGRPRCGLRIADFERSEPS